MATTPNFGWVMPDPTDFVTNLPADFEIFGDDVDADVWAIKGTADAAISKTIVNAAGDLIYGTANDTVTRLGIGTAGQVLQVNSGATAPEWVTFGSGGMTQIASGSLSGSAVNITSIPTTYKDLLLVLRNARPDVDGNGGSMRVNNNSGSIYGSNGYQSTSISNQTATATEVVILAGGTDDTVSESTVRIVFHDYANTSTWKMWNTVAFSNHETTNTNWNILKANSIARTTSAITEINLITPGFNWAGGTYVLYGVL